MSKKRIIIPNTKVDKNNIGKQGLKFDEIYADNIIVDKINNKKADPDYYLKDNFTIIYPNGGSKEAPANITLSTRYIMDNPFPGYIVNTQPEVYYDNEWGITPFAEYYSDRAYATGCYCFQHNNDKIILTTGSYLLITPDGVANGKFKLNQNTFANVKSSISTLPCRIKIWKVGKISDDN